jgi:hypothetical protein
MRIPFIGLSGPGRGRHPHIGSQCGDIPIREKRLVEDVLGIDLPVQNQIDQFGPAKICGVHPKKVDQPGPNWALDFLHF